MTSRSRIRVLGGRLTAAAGRRGGAVGVRVLDAAFGHPRGPLARVGAVLMAARNAEQEALAVRRAELGSGDRVVVVGAGPGVGVQRAAARVEPGGRVLGLDPSGPMRRAARRRCRRQIAAGVVDVQAGTAEHTGCPDTSMDAAISVNNVMLWRRTEGFAELARVLRPGGRLVVSVHRHVLDVRPDQLAMEALDAGFLDLDLRLLPRRRNGPAVELVARRPSAQDEGRGSAEG